MKLYEIDEAIMNCIDPETGEIDEERFDALVIERDKKIENILLLIKDSEAKAKAIADERDALEQRIKTYKNQAQRLRDWITNDILKGENFETARVKATWRRSESVEILSDELVPDRYCDISVVRKPSKKVIKEAMKKGEKVPGAVILEKINLQLK